jgi:hypothetical protein
MFFNVVAYLVGACTSTTKSIKAFASFHVKTYGACGFLYDPSCCNHSLGVATKARACKSVGQEGSSRVTFNVHGSAKECEGMNPHTPKGTPSGSFGGFPNLQRAIAKVKTH